MGRGEPGYTINSHGTEHGRHRQPSVEENRAWSGSVTVRARLRPPPMAAEVAGSTSFLMDE